MAQNLGGSKVSHRRHLVEMVKSVLRDGDRAPTSAGAIPLISPCKCDPKATVRL
jgi:hypothetical protein